MVEKFKARSLKEYFSDGKLSDLVCRIAYQSGRPATYQIIKDRYFTSHQGIDELEIAKRVLILIQLEQLDQAEGGISENGKKMPPATEEELLAAGERYVNMVGQFLLTAEVLEKEDQSEKVSHGVQESREKLIRHKNRISQNSSLLALYNEGVKEAYTEKVVSIDTLIKMLEDGRIDFSAIRYCGITLKDLVDAKYLTKQRVFELEKNGKIRKNTILSEMELDWILEYYHEEPEKRTRILKMFPREQIVEMYIKGKLEESNLLKCVSSIDTLVKEGDVSGDTYILFCKKVSLLQKENPKQYAKMRSLLLSEKRIDEIYREEGLLSSKEMSQLAALGMYPVEKAFAIYRNQEEYIEEERISSEELKQFITVEYITGAITQGKINSEIVQFYLTYLMEQDQRARLVNKIITDWKEQDPSRFMENMMSLYHYGLITGEELKQQITSEEIIGLSDARKVETRDLVSLLKEDCLTAQEVGLIVDDMGNKRYLLEMAREDSSYYPVLQQIQEVLKDLDGELTQGEIEEEIGNTPEKNRPNQIVSLFSISLLPESVLKKEYKEGIVTEDFLFQTALDGKMSEEKIVDIYLAGLLSEHKLLVLNQNQKMSDQGLKRALRELKEEHILKVLAETYEQVPFDEEAILATGEQFTTANKRKSTVAEEKGVKPAKDRKILDPILRAEYIKGLGADLRFERKDTETENDSFRSYYFCYDAARGIVVAEDFLHYGNATYVYSLEDYYRMCNKPRSEVAAILKGNTDLNIRRIAHTKHWSSKVMNAVEEIQVEGTPKFVSSESLENLMRQLAEDFYRDPLDDREV